MHLYKIVNGVTELAQPEDVLGYIYDHPMLQAWLEGMFMSTPYHPPTHRSGSGFFDEDYDDREL